MEATSQQLNSEYDAFSELYRAHYPQMLRVARYYLESMALAEDVISEVFAKLWERRAEVADIKDPKSYLFIMVKRKCLDELDQFRSKRHEDFAKMPPHFLVTARNPETAYINKELSERIAASLQKLPDKCRTVFLLVKEDKLRYKEVANLLDISEKTVEMHVGNALKALREDLAAYVPTAKNRKKSAFRSISVLLFSFL